MPHIPTIDTSRFGLTGNNGIIAILIGLLLPAVQKVREAARVQMIGSSGELLADIPLPTGPTAPGAVAVHLSVETVWDDTDIVHVVHFHQNRQTWTFRTRDGVFTPVILPAVQRDGKIVPPLAGGFQVICDGSVRTMGGLYGGGGPAEGGDTPTPAQVVFGDGSVRFLLPAVQRPRQPHLIQVVDAFGNPIARVPAEAPARPRGTFTVGLQFSFGDGSVRVDQLLGDGSVRPVGGGLAPLGRVAVLLLPAVQRNGQPALGGIGSVQAGPHVFEMGVGYLPR